MNSLFVAVDYHPPEGAALPAPSNFKKLVVRHLYRKQVKECLTYMTYYPNISVELAETIKEYDINKRNKFFESKHMRSVFECLQMFGFKVEGLEDSEIKSLRIQYPQQPSVIIAL